MSKSERQDFRIRFADKNDSSLVLNFIRQLAEFERLPHEVSATEELILENVFMKKRAEVVIAEHGSEPVGFALFFHNFSTFLGKPGIYLEDLYVKPEFRSKGFGKRLLIFLAGLARERDCGRLEWAVLKWNERAISFYDSLGARPMNEWTVYRITGAELSALADSSA